MKKLKNIFVIDNDPVSNFVSEKIINFLGLTEKITTFLGGEDALEFLKCNNISDQDYPEIIMLDLDMPCMNGFQFLKALKKLKIEHKFIVVILSTSVYSKNIELVKSKGLKFYVAKPLDVNKMKEVYRLIELKDETQEFIFIQ